MKKDVYAIRSNLGFLNVLGFIMLFIGDKMKSVVFHFSLIPFFIVLALGVYIVVKNWSFKKIRIKRKGIGKETETSEIF